MKILLLTVSSTSFFYDQVVVPFGLVSLGSYIQGSMDEIKGIEMNSPPEKIGGRYLQADEQIVREIKEFSPDIVAMSTYASNIYNVMFWAEVIKKTLPNCFIMIGGNHVSYMAEECLSKCSALDVVVTFEGEIPFKMVCDQLRENKVDFSQIPGIAYRVDQKIKQNQPAVLIEDLNEIPALNMDYFEHPDKTREEIVHADMISARGCPFNCTFCNCNHYWHKKYRMKSVDQVIDELRTLKARYPRIASVRFRDESLTIKGSRCVLLCEAIKKDNLGIKFEAHSRLDGLNEEVISALASAGFQRLFIGMESGSPAVLERIKKEIDIDRAEEIVSLLRKYQVGFRISFMCGTPGERFSETMETIKLIRRLKLTDKEYYLGFGIQIYPGTAECSTFLDAHPHYEWISKTNQFKGKYFAYKDPQGNILNPSHCEYGVFLRALIVFLLNRKVFIDRLKNRVKTFFV